MRARMCVHAHVIREAEQSIKEADVNRRVFRHRFDFSAVRQRSSILGRMYIYFVIKAHWLRHTVISPRGKLVMIDNWRDYKLAEMTRQLETFAKTQIQKPPRADRLMSALARDRYERAAFRKCGSSSKERRKPDEMPLCGVFQRVSNLFL